MSTAEKVYAPPRVLSANEIPAGVLNYLNGEDLLSKTQALRLSTVDADGWPKATLLSAGVLALPNGRIRLAIFANSGTAANLERDGRLILGMALDGGMCSLRMRARKCSQGMPELSLSFFEAEVERVRMHVAPYADVTVWYRMSMLPAASASPCMNRQPCLSAGIERSRRYEPLPDKPLKQPLPRGHESLQGPS